MNTTAVLSVAWTLSLPVAFSCQAVDARSEAAREEAAPIDPRIWCIAQDRRGDMWFGSNGSGVYRYDGERITNFTSDDGLVGSQVRDIRIGPNGEVLVGTHTGAALFDGERWTPLEVQDAPEGGGWELRPDDVWLMVHLGGGGPCRYDGEKLYRLELTGSPAEAAHRAKFPDIDFQPYGIYSVYKDRKGHLWFGTFAVGLCRFDGETTSWMFEERLTTTPEGGAFGIRSIYEDRDGAYWVCNTRQRFVVSPQAELEDGFSRLRYEKREGLPGAGTDDGEHFTYYTSVAEDDNGVLWFACGDDGVLVFDGETVTRHRVAEGAFVVRVFHDRSGTVWATSLEHGIHRFDGERFQPFRPGTG